MKYLWLGLLLCLPAFAAPCPTGQEKDGSALVRAEEGWARALEQGDRGALECILAEEFEDARPDGTLADRQKTLSAVSKPRPVHNEFAEMRPEVHGDFGYIRGLATERDAQGKVLARVRFTDIYVYRDGRWQCVAGHESLLKK